MLVIQSVPNAPSPCKGKRNETIELPSIRFNSSAIRRMNCWHSLGIWPLPCSFRGIPCQLVYSERNQKHFYFPRFWWQRWVFVFPFFSRTGALLTLLVFMLPTCQRIYENNNENRGNNSTAIMLATIFATVVAAFCLRKKPKDRMSDRTTEPHRRHPHGSTIRHGDLHSCFNLLQLE